MKITFAYLFILAFVIIIFSCKKEETKNTTAGSFNGVIDSTPPSIFLLGDHPALLPYGTSYIEGGFSVEDNVDGDLNVDVIISGSIDSSQVGVDSLIYNVSDAAGNQAVPVTRNVFVSYIGSQLVGLYYVEELCESNQFSYSITTNASTNSPLDLIFTNFADVFTDPVYATIDGNILNIPLQIPIVGSDFTLEGEGIISSQNGTIVLTVEYTVVNNGQIFICNFTAAMQ
jgi:Domain of unknown function (DUF5011)